MVFLHQNVNRDEVIKPQYGDEVSILSFSLFIHTMLSNDHFKYTCTLIHII